MNLVRDVLDKLVADDNGRAIGRVDGVIMTIVDDEQPHIVAIEIGSVALARRVHPAFARWVERMARRWGRMKPNPYAIPWSLVRADRWKFYADVDAKSIPTLAWERWLARHVLSRIPGA